MDNPKPHIVGLAGSLRPRSATRRAVEIALSGSSASGASTELIDLRDFDLPLCAGMDSDISYPESVMKLRAIVKGASGIILGTPEYHGSYSGVLKNALDLMGFDQFELKMVGLVSVSGGAMGGVEAMTGLRVVCRALHAWVVPNQAAISSAYKHLGPDKDPDEHIVERLRGVGSQVARFSVLHSDRVGELIREHICATSNPGAEG